MNSRRLMGLTPLAENHLVKKSNTILERELCTAMQQNRRTDVRYGSLAGIAAALPNVRFTPKADIGTQSLNVRFVQMRMSVRIRNCWRRQIVGRHRRLV